MRKKSPIILVFLICLSCQNETTETEEKTPHVFTENNEVIAVTESSLIKEHNIPVDTSFENFQSYFKAIELPYSFKTREIFDVWDTVDSSIVPISQLIPDTLMKTWLPNEGILKDDLSHLIDPFPSQYPEDLSCTCQLQPYGGFRFEMNYATYFVYYNSIMLGATNGGMWQVWLTKFDKNHKLVQYQVIGVSGVYSTDYYTEENGYPEYHAHSSFAETEIHFKQDKIVSVTSPWKTEYHTINNNTEKESTVQGSKYEMEIGL